MRMAHGRALAPDFSAGASRADAQVVARMLWEYSFLTQSCMRRTQATQEKVGALMQLAEANKRAKGRASPAAAKQPGGSGGTRALRPARATVQPALRTAACRLAARPLRVTRTTCDAQQFCETRGAWRRPRPRLPREPAPRRRGPRAQVWGAHGAAAPAAEGEASAAKPAAGSGAAAPASLASAGSAEAAVASSGAATE